MTSSLESYFCLVTQYNLPGKMPGKIRVSWQGRSVGFKPFVLFDVLLGIHLGPSRLSATPGKSGEIRDPQESEYFRDFR